MTDDIGDILEHYGVLGMKWGIRKDRRTGVIKARATMNRADRKDREAIETLGSKFGQNENVMKAYDKTYRRAAGKIRAGTRALNKDPRFAGKDFRVDSPLRREYYDAYSKLVMHQLNAASARKGRVGRQYEVSFSFDANKQAWPTVDLRKRSNRADRKAQYASRKEAVHADDGEDVYTLKLKLDPMGYILDIEDEDSLENFLEHEDVLGDILEHYGVLGMKWGVRKDRRTGDGSKRSNASSGKAPTPVKKTPAASDAAKVRMGEKYKTVEGLNAKQKSKAGRSGLSSNDLSLKQLKETAERLRLENEINGLLDTMTDKDRAMQTAVNRIKLEEEYRRLTAAPPTKRQRMMAYTKSVLLSVADTQLKAGINAVAASYLDKTLAKQGIMTANYIKSVQIKAKQAEEAAKAKASADAAKKTPDGGRASTRQTKSEEKRAAKANKKAAEQWVKAQEKVNKQREASQRRMSQDNDPGFFAARKRTDYGGLFDGFYAYDPTFVPREVEGRKALPPPAPKRKW